MYQKLSEGLSIISHVFFLFSSSLSPPLSLSRYYHSGIIEDGHIKFKMETYHPYHFNCGSCG